MRARRVGFAGLMSTVRWGIAFLAATVSGRAVAVVSLAAQTEAERGPCADASCSESEDSDDAKWQVVSLLQHQGGRLSGTPDAKIAADPNSTSPPACLCVFDIDRTLTGKQSVTNPCTHNQVQKGVFDNAYSRGDLTLSELALQINQTFCNDCYIGVVSMGNGDGSHSAERRDIYEHLKKTHGQSWDYFEEPWNPASGCEDVSGPLVTSCKDGHKQVAVSRIVDLYKKTKDVTIEKENVYMFDDREENIRPFLGTGYNAHQISCKYRDGGDKAIGLCGAALDEVTNRKGVAVCPCTSTYCIPQVPDHLPTCSAANIDPYSSGSFIPCCTGKPKGVLRQWSGRSWTYRCSA